MKGGMISKESELDGVKRGNNISYPKRPKWTLNPVSMYHFPCLRGGA